MVAQTENPPAALRVGLCQVHTEAWDVEGNFRRLLQSLEEAHRQGAELAITPECVLHGYGFEDPDAQGQRLAEVAEPADGPRLRALGDSARQFAMDIVLGFAEKGEGGAIHNSAALLSRRGELLWVYRKVHCRNFETRGRGGPFEPGDRFYVTPLKFREGSFRIGAMICFDREVAESVRCLRSLGAEFIACPLATNTFPMFAPENRADNELITRCRAAENEVFIAVVNHAGRFNGGSFVVGPTGECLCQLGAEAETRVLEVPVGEVQHRFHTRPWGWMGWGYRRPEVYARYL
jgi:predicted amidohydrolase